MRVDVGEVYLQLQVILESADVKELYIYAYQRDKSD